jgi:hypothetical protein
MGPLRALGAGCDNRGQPDMPPLIVWAFGAIGAAVVAKWLVRQGRRVSTGLRPHAAGSGQAGEEDARPTLRRDPITGIYSPS